MTKIPRSLAYDMLNGSKKMTKEELGYFIDGIVDKMEQDGDIIEFLGQQVVEIKNMRLCLKVLLEGLI